MSKAEQAGTPLPPEVAFFIAKRIRSNIRELEGALKRVVANAHFTGSAITVDFAKGALRDLLALQDKLVTVENIQKTVAEYYKIRLSDLLSKRRSRSIARPGNWPWHWLKSSPATACPRLVKPLAVGTTQQ